MEQQPVPIKLVIVGDGFVGKTCILISHTRNKYPTQYVPTVFDNYSNIVKVDGKIVELQLWDTAGQEEYSRLRSLAYSNCDVFLIVFSVMQPNTWVNACKWYPELCQHSTSSVPKIFVGNKIDQRKKYNCKQKDPQKKPVQYQTAKKFIQENFKDSIYFECSAYTQEGIKKVFNQAIRSGLQKKTKSRMRKNKESNGLCSII